MPVLARVRGSGNSTMTVTTATKTPAGTYSLTISGYQPDHRALDKRLAYREPRRHGELQPPGALVHESGFE